jgi:hypothetical protein
MINFTLQQTLNVYDYIVELYSIDNIAIDSSSLSTVLLGLNDTSMPNDIVNVLTNITGVYKIRILDLDNNLLLNSEKYLP